MAAWQDGSCRAATERRAPGDPSAERCSSIRGVLGALAWLACQKHHPRRAVVLMAAAEAPVRTVGASTVVLPHLQVFHDECEHSAREALGAKEFEAARQEGLASNFDEAVAHAMVV